MGSGGAKLGTVLRTQPTHGHTTFPPSRTAAAAGTPRQLWPKIEVSRVSLSSLSPPPSNHDTKLPNSPVASVFLFLRNVYCHLLRDTRRGCIHRSAKATPGLFPTPLLGVTAKTPRPTKTPST